MLKQCETVALTKECSAAIQNQLPTKRWHDKHIMKKWFEEDDMVLLFNSKLWLFSSRLRSQWLRPFTITNFFPYRAIEVWSKSTGAFKANRQRLKPYLVGDPFNRPLCIDKCLTCTSF